MNYLKGEQWNEISQQLNETFIVPGDSQAEQFANEMKQTMIDMIMDALRLYDEKRS
nr:MAG TPA: hypothetical protein [Caudoviricetes sp.]